MKAIIIIALGLLGGCDSGIKDDRSTPAKQVEDFKTCIDGGMRPYLTQAATILCSVPTEMRK
jgi:hypothetical protein